MTGEPIDPDILVLRRIFAASKTQRKHKAGRGAASHWLSGVRDNEPYFQAGLAALKLCRAEGLIL